MIIFGAPSRYLQGAGAIKLLGQELARLGDSAVLVLDPLVQDRYGVEIARSCTEASLDVTQLRFAGECTPGEIDRLLALSGGSASIVGAAGGGKCIDAGKALANRIGAFVVTIPTVASTDAPTSHNYVMYDDEHRMLGVEKLKRNPALVIVDTEIIVQAPKQLFLAGIGDAIGKIYEVEACANNRGFNIHGGQSSWAAVALARSCHALLLEQAEDALASIDRGVPDETFERVVEATVLMSGLAFESGGLSIAHSMTRGITALKPWSTSLHGLQVAYANLVQLRLEGRSDDEILALADFYRRIGLPCSLAELAASPDPTALKVIAEKSMTAPHIRHFPRTIDADELQSAMVWVETRFATC